MDEAWTSNEAPAESIGQESANGRLFDVIENMAPTSKRCELNTLLTNILFSYMLKYVLLEKLPITLTRLSVINFCRENLLPWVSPI